MNNRWFYETKYKLRATMIFAVPLAIIAIVELLNGPLFPTEVEVSNLTINVEKCVEGLLVVPIVLVNFEGYKTGIITLFSKYPSKESLITVATATCIILGNHTIAGLILAIVILEEYATKAICKRIGLDMDEIIARDTDSTIIKMTNNVSRMFIPIVMAVAIVVTSMWLLARVDVEDSIMIGVSILVIASPTSLNMAIPISIMVGASKAYRYGISVNDTRVLEISSKINTVVLDNSLLYSDSEEEAKNLFESVLRGTADYDKTPNIVSIKAIDEIEAMGMDVIVFTDEDRDAALKIKEQLGVDEVLLAITDQDKESEIQALRLGDKRVIAMIDKPSRNKDAMRASDVAIVIGGETKPQNEESGLAEIHLLNDDLYDVPIAIKLCNKTLANIKQNLIGAYCYNALGIIIATGALYPIVGWLLSPIIAALCMSISTILLMLNAMRFNETRLR